VAQVVEEAGAQPCAGAGEVTSSPTLLVVDDEEGVATTLAAVLETDGYAVEVASSVGQALDLIATTSFTAAVLDLNVGHDDGLDVLARLKETSPATVAVVLTGYATLGSALGAIRAGVDGYLVKPCDVDELRATIARGRERVERAAAERTALLGALDEARERLTVVVEHLPVGVILARAPSGHLLLGNRAVERIWRRPFLAAAEVGDYAGYRGFHPDGRPYLPEDWPLARAIASGAIVQGELIEITRGDGTRGVIRNHAAPLRDAEGQIVAGVVVFEDVTDEIAARRASAIAADRTARLERLARALAWALTPAQTAGAVLRELRPALGASAGLVALADAEGATLEIVAAAGFPSELIDRWRRTPTDAALASTRAYRSGQLVVFGSRAEAEAAMPDAAARMAAAGHDQVVAAPLQVEDRRLGAFVVGFDERRRFDEAEREFVMAVAAQCAQALDRARLHGETQRAERHQRLVADASRLLAEARLDQAAVLDALARAVGASSVADTCTIHLLDRDGAALRLAAVHDPDPDRAALRRALLAEHPLRVGEGLAGAVVERGQPIVAAGDRAAFEAGLKPAYRPHADRLFFAGVAVVPLRGRGGVLGALAAERVGASRPFDPPDVDLLQEIADRAALAIENALLYERARRAERMQRLLAEATGALAASLDYEATLARVARLAVPTLADWCIVYMARADGVGRLTAAHADPAGQALLDRLGGERPDSRRPPDPVAGVIATGQSILLPEIEPAQVERHARDAEHLDVMSALDPQSAMVVPLVGREATLGALAFASTAAERRYDRTDLAVAEELARRCALAVENARLYAVARRELAERERAEAAQQRAAARTRRLQEITQQLSRSLDADEVLASIAESAASLLEAPVGAVFLLDRGDADADFALAAAHGIDPAAAPRLRLPRHASLAGRAVDEDRALVVDDVAAATAGTSLPWLLTGETAGSEIAAPITAGVERLGVVKAYSPTGRRFTPDDAALLTALAAAAAVALTNARLYREAREAIAARDEFLSIAAHELRTPVTSLRGNVQLLARMKQRDQLDEARLDRFVGALGDSATRLAALIDDLLDVSRIQSGRLALRTRELDLCELIGRLTAAREAVIDRRHRLETVLPDGGCWLTGDPDRLAQVIENLLDNALKYSPDGGLVRISVEAADGEVRVQVADEGIGLPAGSADAIFEPFGRGVNAVDRALPGMGLGLYICRSIAERHGGRLWAESPGEERGTTVHLSLPTSHP
jgi:signal transduction histidine kinase/ActR/RegA family two-component response regulator